MQGKGNIIATNGIIFYCIHIGFIVGLLHIYSVISFCMKISQKYFNNVKTRLVDLVGQIFEVKLMLG